MTDFHLAPARSVRKKKIASREPRRLADAAEWTELRTRILSALDPYPDALAALLTIIQEHPQ